MYALKLRQNDIRGVNVSSDNNERNNIHATILERHTPPQRALANGLTSML